MNQHHYPRKASNKQRGQGIIEYAGAMIIAALVVVMLASATQEDNWMYNAYEAILDASQDLLINKAEEIKNAQ